jgi:hypothetical protein
MFVSVVIVGLHAERQGMIVQEAKVADYAAYLIM